MKSKIISIKENPFLFYILLFGLISSFIFYIYCINSTVKNGVAHNDMESGLRQIKDNVSDLEYQYLAAQNSLTIETARSLGLAEPDNSNKIFIPRSHQKKLSLNN